MKKKKYHDIDAYNLSHFCDNDPESNQDTQDRRKNGSDVASQESSKSSIDNAKSTETMEDVDEKDSMQSIKSSENQYLKIPKDQGHAVKRPVIYKKNFVRCLSPRQYYRTAQRSNVAHS
ncbi:hypothetical protein THOM_1204 [Trachipleistophora hominis]|uniref:Uncharacterized protein n=1 Tax=Trachipleistophora hominis TaxID=72359 RepID=L7JYL4_TRAHO|nr:hypothetical protein THOM_1204 [Trachipleistophora hominis]